MNKFFSFIFCILLFLIILLPINTNASTINKNVLIYEKTMKVAVNQFLAVVESVNKQKQSLDWKLKQIFKFNQAIKANYKNIDLTYYIFDDQMRLLDSVDFKQYVGKDFYEWKDVAGNKPFQILHKEIIKNNFGFVECNWPITGGQFQVPSVIHGQICFLTNQFYIIPSKYVVLLIVPKDLIETIPELLLIKIDIPEYHFNKKPNDISRYK